MRTSNRSSLRLTTCTLLVLFVLSLALSGCASRGGRTYRDSDVRSPQTVKYGVVADVTQVTVEEDPDSGVGLVLGGVTGGVIGNLFGGGKGRVLSTVGGAALGALAGTYAESQLQRYDATQITVDLDDGSSLVIVQQDDELFVPGDRVRVVGNNQSARVQHAR